MTFTFMIVTVSFDYRAMSLYLSMWSDTCRRRGKRGWIFVIFLSCHAIISYIFMNAEIASRWKAKSKDLTAQFWLDFAKVFLSLVLNKFEFFKSLFHLNDGTCAIDKLVIGIELFYVWHNKTEKTDCFPCSCRHLKYCMSFWFEQVFELSHVLKLLRIHGIIRKAHVQISDFESTMCQDEFAHLPHLWLKISKL